MKAFARLYSPLPRPLRHPRRFVCSARLIHQPVPPAIASKNTFVVLSDLHVKRETLQTCLQALQFAHDQALSRDAAVLFLGDFWHARGNLPVEPLNAILTHLANWKVPLIMIPGNHDLVSRSGNGVSLVPLATTLKDTCLLITTPSVCLDALFIPYMHDLSALKAVLSEAAVTPQPVHAIFCHVEVAGARLADRLISPLSPRSLKPTDFPPATRVYSGHIHRPHTVSDTIRYVGSPYQVSAAEHGQEKSLLVLDRSIGWQVVDRIPIDVGPRHFSFSLESSNAMPELRRGDRVTIQTSSDDLEIVETLRDQGIRVEVQPVINGFPSSSSQDGLLAVEPRITAGTLSNTDLFRRYAAFKNLGTSITRAGIEILQDVGGRTSSVSGKDVLIQWQSVTLRGFGTFRETVTYPLSHRGLVLVTGRDCDDDTAITGRTNATGKTTLVMAALWAMTGRTDARPDGSVEKGVSLEMVHDESKDCEVVVRMHIGGHRVQAEAYDMMSAEERSQVQMGHSEGPLPTELLDVVVARTSTRNGTLSKTRSYKQGLCLTVNGVDVSCLDVKETQNRIDRLVDGTLLPHTVFFGQHMGAGRGLLDSTDRALKDHLSLIFPLDIWKEARKRGRTKLLRLQELQVTSEASLQAAKAVVTRLEATEVVSKQQWATFESDRSRRVLDIQDSILEKIASRSDWKEDSIVFSDSFLVSGDSDNMTCIIEDLKRYMNVLEQDNGEKLDMERVSAAAAVARTETLLQSDEELQGRISSLANRTIEWEEGRDERLAEIQEYLDAAQKELDGMKSSAEIDVAWKDAINRLQICDERLQGLVGVRVASGEGGNTHQFAEQFSRVKSARHEADTSQQEKVKLQTSLNEIRSRLLQSEELPLFGVGPDKGEIVANARAAPLVDVTCEKCLRPFDGVLYEEARSRLENEARIIETTMQTTENTIEGHLSDYEDAVRSLSDEVDMEKSRIIEEKQSITQALGVIRAMRDQRTALVMDVSLYGAKAEKLREEENLYLGELLSFGLKNEEHHGNVGRTVKLICQNMEVRKERGVAALNTAKINHENIVSRIKDQEQELQDKLSRIDAIRRHIVDLQQLQSDLRHMETDRHSIRAEANPYEESLKMLLEELARETAIVEKRETEFSKLSKSIAVLKAIDVAFGPRGVPSFILEEGLTWLERLTGKFLQPLSGGELMLKLRGYSDYKSSSKVDGENKEVISKRIFVRKQGRTKIRERTLRQLSGGQRRRCSLSFALAFAMLAHEKAGFQSSLIVLDEILQSLDQDGRVRMAKILPGLLKEKGGTRDSVVVVAQDEAPEIAAHAHGGIDAVERKGDESKVLLDRAVTE